MDIVHIYQQPRLKQLFTKVSEGPFCYFLVGVEHGNTIGFEYALPYFTNAKEYGNQTKAGQLDNYLEALVTALPGGLFVTGILVNDKVDANVSENIFKKLNNFGSKLKFGSSKMAKVTTTAGKERKVEINDNKEYTYDDGEKLVAVPLKQYKSIFALYKLNIAVTAKSQKITDIANSIKQFNFFEENEDDDSSIQRNLFYTVKSAEASNQNICIEFAGNIPVFYPYLLSDEFKQTIFANAVMRALTSTVTDMIAVSVQPKDINGILPPLVFYSDNREDYAEIIQDSYRLLTKEKLENVKIRSLYGKADLNKIKVDTLKKKDLLKNEKVKGSNMQPLIIASAATALLAIILAYYLL